MKIQSTPGFQAYQNYLTELKSADSSAVKSKEERTISNQNTDTVSFSGSAAARAAVARVSQHVAAETNEVGNAQRLAQLTESIAQGRYFIDTDALASSILGEV